MPKPPKTVEIVNIRSWSKFEAQIEKLDRRRQQLEEQHHRRFEFFFRGIGNSTWGLETTLERSFPTERSRNSRKFADYYSEIYPAEPVLATFWQRNWPNLPIPPDFEKMLKNSDAWHSGLPGDAVNVYEYMIYLRHHGFPSPFLDWTASPYVAAFFAFDLFDRKAKHVSVYALLKDSMRGYSSGQANVSMMGPYARSHPRHFVQQSRYSICIELVDNECLFAQQEPAVLKDGAGIEGQLIKIRIPATERVRALRSLELMNVNPFSLYQSEDS